MHDSMIIMSVCWHLHHNGNRFHTQTWWPHIPPPNRRLSLFPKEPISFISTQMCLTMYQCDNYNTLSFLLGQLKLNIISGRVIFKNVEIYRKDDSIR